MTTQLRVLWAEQSFSFSSLMRSLVSCSSSTLFLFTIIVAVSVNFMGTCKLIVITTAFQVTNLFMPLNGTDLSNYHYICYTHVKPVLYTKDFTTNKVKPHKALSYIFETTDRRPYLFLPKPFRTNTKKAFSLNLIYTSFDSG